MFSPLPVLYSFRRCPFAIRARMSLYFAKIPHEHREVILKNKPAEMLAVSPKATVPVLQLADKTVLEESLDIMLWAFGMSFLRKEERLLIIENDTVFKHALDRYKYPGRYSEEVGVNYRERCEWFLKKLEVQLMPFLSGDMVGLTDMAVFPFIRQFSMVDVEWFNDQAYPRLKEWMAYFVSGSLFEKVMQKHPAWSPYHQPAFVVF